MKSHQRKYYGSLFVITFLMIATAMLLTRSGNNDVTGMATSTATASVEASDVISLTAGQETDFGKIETAVYDSTTSMLTITAKGNQYQYEIVYVGDDPYAKWETADGTVYYTDKSAIMYTVSAEGELQKVVANGGADPNLMNYDLKAIPALTEAFAKSEEELAAFDFGSDIGVALTEQQEAAMQKFATDNHYDYEDVKGEYQAINAYLLSSDATQTITYNPVTSHYTGTMEYGGTKYDVEYHNDDIGITTTVQNQKGESVDVTIYKDTSSIPPTYYTLGDKGQKVSYKPDATTKENIRDAEHAVEDVEEDIQQEMQKCAKAKSDEECQLTYTTDDGTTIRLDATARQEAFMNRMYAEQEAKVQGLIAGWLNGWLDEKLGGWSRGVPAGICAYFFGLEYYKQDGWTRVTMNASVDQLQSQLIANSRTVIIEGEKEEITEEMFRYAYTIKLLANQSVEWQTYLYNSCTGETSVDTFYDYGSLLAGGYFAFHYAGAGAQDMIFECTNEICLYDQACVVFADGTAPTCVSLVHGAGFETPVAGNDYDCAITG